ncbi:MAG TPA: hypothetical protein VF384_13975 [Planctomycetota bacterium]
MACSGSSSNDGPPVIAAATIGPEGGVITVGSGVQAGLMLTIPAGAVATPTAFRIRDLTPPPIPGVSPLVRVEPPSQPFLVEPAVRFEELATLRAPYRPMHVYHTAPGNVRARHVRNGNTIDFEPAVVDITSAHIELPIRHAGHYQVIQAQPVALSSYWQQPGTVVSLAGDLTFGVEEVPAESPFAGPAAQRWRIAGPYGTDLLYFDAERLRGRESVLGEWREVWNESYPVWTHSSLAPSVGSLTTATQVSSPTTALPLSGQMTVFGIWSWGEPRRVGEQQLLDVIHLRISLTWNRHDLGVGQREYMFWFAPGHGLIAFSQDGVVRSRLSL